MAVTTISDLLPEIEYGSKEYQELFSLPRKELALKLDSLLADYAAALARMQALFLSTQEEHKRDLNCAFRDGYDAGYKNYND
jgi:hypothetical protein